VTHYKAGGKRRQPDANSKTSHEHSLSAAA